MPALAAGPGLAPTPRWRGLLLPAVRPLSRLTTRVAPPGTSTASASSLCLSCSVASSTSCCGFRNGATRARLAVRSTCRAGPGEGDEARAWLQAWGPQRLARPRSLWWP